MPKKKETEQEKMDKAFQTATGMKVVQPSVPPAENTGKTEFAKDVYTETPPIAPNPGGE